MTRRARLIDPIGRCSVRACQDVNDSLFKKQEKHSDHNRRKTSNPHGARPRTNLIIKNDHSNHEKQIAKGNMADQPKRPEYEQNHEDCPEHKIVLIKRPQHRRDRQGR